MNPRKSLVPLAIALGLSLGASAQPSLAGHCEFGLLAVFATNSIRLGVDVAVTGDVVANNDSSGPVLDEGVELALDRNATITGDASAFQIDLDKDATVTGNQIILTSPAFAPGDIPAFLQADVRSNAQDVVVAPGPATVLGASSLVCSVSLTSCTADPDCPAGESCVAGRITSYRDILILQGGTLVFAEGGRFDVRSITSTTTAGPCKASTAPCRSVQFDGPTELAIEGRLDPERGVYFGPSGSSGIDASDIAVYVGGQNGATGGLFETPRAANVGRDSEVHANFYVPNGTFELERDSAMTGAVLAADVQIDKGSTIVLDSAFVNEAPIADALTIGVVSNDPVTFELTGSDPEGDSLAFSIEIQAVHGTATILDEIQDPGQCSETVATVCDEDADCPGVETCVLPPVSRATVEYDPDDCALVGDELTCPTDAFTFGVRDSCGALGTALVDVNPDDPGAPPPVNVVEADDIEVDVEVGSVSEISLSAGAPESVLSLTFAVETLPSAGSIEDEASNPITTVPYDLPSPVVVYSAPASPGADDFIFSARDSTTGSPPCGSPSCDTGTVNIAIGERPPLAQPLSVETSLNQPVQITLQGNPGGTGTGAGPQAQQSVSYEGQPISTGSGNGAPSKRLDSRKRSTSGPQPLAPVGLVFDAGWTATTLVPPAFFWTGGNGTFADDNYTFSGAGCLSVTDDFQKGDRFRIYDNGDAIFTTSNVPEVTGAEIGPDAAFADPTYSSGSLSVGAGSHDITIEVVVSPYGGGRGYIRVDTGSCEPSLLYTVVTLPPDSAGTLRTLSGAAVSAGQTFAVTAPTLVFTPKLAFTGSTSFNYSVTEGPLSSVATVGILVSNLLDNCTPVGRDPGCAPGGGGSGPQSQGPSQEELEREVAAGPSRGLTVTVEGSGSVATSSIRLTGDRVLRGLICGGGTCNKILPEGAEISLYARPEGANSEFVRWEGACGGTEQITSVRLADHTRCTAVFGEKAGE